MVTVEVTHPEHLAVLLRPDSGDVLFKEGVEGG
jgi:hypothetical protein